MEGIGYKWDKSQQRSCKGQSYSCLCELWAVLALRRPVQIRPFHCNEQSSHHFQVVTLVSWYNFTVVCLFIDSSPMNTFAHTNCKTYWSSVHCAAACMQTYACVLRKERHVPNSLRVFLVQIWIVLTWVLNNMLPSHVTVLCCPRMMFPVVVCFVWTFEFIETQLMTTRISLDIPNNSWR